MQEQMISKLYGPLFLVVLSIGFLCGFRTRTLAAASPAAGVIVAQPPSEIAVDFANPLEVVFIRLQVFDESGRDHAISPPLIGADRKRVSVRVDALKPGAFTVQMGSC